MSDRHPTSNRVQVNFKHEGSGAWVEGAFDEREPTGKIHVFALEADGHAIGPTAAFWGSITEARRLAEVIGAKLYDY